MSNDLMFKPRGELKKMKASLNLGVFCALAVSFFVSIYYWYILSGLAMHVFDGYFTTGMLYAVVATGAVMEIFKKLAITNNKRGYWIAFTAVSVVTCMGSYMMLDQNRQVELNKSSEAYAKTSATQDKAMIAKMATAYAKDYTTDKAIADRKENKRAYKDDKNYPYATYLSVEKEIKKKIADKNAYDSAVAVLGDTGTELKNGDTGEVSNPLLANVAKHTANGDTAIVTMIFFLSVTILMEMGAFVFGSQSQDVKAALTLTEREIANMTNRKLFGHDLEVITPSTAGLNHKHGAALNHKPDTKAPQKDASQQDAPQADNKAQQEALARYNLAVSKKRGDSVDCPLCVTAFTKKNDQHIYCSNKGANNCKDEYANLMNPARIGARK